MDVYMPAMEGNWKEISKWRIKSKDSGCYCNCTFKRNCYIADNLTVVKQFVQKPLAKKKLKEIFQDYYY